MRKLPDLKDKKITVMGLGLNQGGLGVAKFLAESGAQLLITDLKREGELAQSLAKLKEFSNIQYVLGQHRAQDFSNTDMVIRNPAVPNDSEYLRIAKRHNVPVETDLSLFFKICPSQNFIAVGGTKGKSTVSNLIYHTFSRAQKNIVYAGNIGISVFEVLPKITPDTIVLLEISSWQLEGLSKIHFKPRVSVLTNILADHLDRYDSFPDYVLAKKLIFKNQSQTDYLITNMDNPITKNINNETNANVFLFSTKAEPIQGSYLKDDKLLFKYRDRLTEFYSIGDIPLPGIHNVSNVLAASIVFFLHELPLHAIQKSIETFPGVPNRLEKVRFLRGITFYNDTCATTPDATIAAIQSFPKEPLIIILGGKDKNLDYNELCDTLKAKENIIKLIILHHPEYSASKLICQKLQRMGLDKKIELCSSMSEAVKKAYKQATPETKIILSPAAASFGMFANEFERGYYFRQAVQGLN